jgi:hypothetical protein
MKSFLLLFFVSGICLATDAQTKKPVDPTDKKVNDLLAKMTLGRKSGPDDPGYTRCSRYKY